jgi:hypothetical protein
LDLIQFLSSPTWRHQLIGAVVSGRDREEKWCGQADDLVLGVGRNLSYILFSSKADEDEKEQVSGK